MQEFGGTPRTSLQLFSLVRSISHLITLRTLRDHRMLISNRGAELLMDSSAKFPPGRGEADTKATSPLSRQAFPLILLTGATGYIGGQLLRALQEREHLRPLHGKTSGAFANPAFEGRACAR